MRYLIRDSKKITQSAPTYEHTEYYAMNGNTPCTAVSNSTFDQNPYLFRPTAGKGSIDCWDKIVGGTLCWYQLIQNGNFTSATGWYVDRGTISVSGNECKYTVTQIGAYENSNRIERRGEVSLINGHRYLVVASGKSPSNVGRLKIEGYSTATGGNPTLLPNRMLSSDYVSYSNIYTHGLSTANDYTIRVCINNGLTIGDEFYIKNCMLIDITQMFGPTIADYIASLERATSGAGAVWFKKLFPKSYYKHNSGEMMSVCTNAHITRGFNQWDEEWESGAYNISSGDKVDRSDTIRCKNYIRIFPSTKYYCHRDHTIFSAGMRPLFYDINKNFISSPGKQSDVEFTTPEGAYYMTFYIVATNYNGGININLSQSDRNGDYEPYVEHRYPLSPVELRGFPMLDTNNNLYFDGDIYEKTGKVTRRYAIKKLKDFGGDGWLPSYENCAEGYISYRSRLVDAKTATGNYDVARARTPYFSIRERLPAPWSEERFMVVNSYYNVIFVVKLSDFPTAQSFVDAFGEMPLLYERVTPITETAEPFADPQIVNEFGTEEYVDALATDGTNPRDVAIPVGHKTVYF